MFAQVKLLIAGKFEEFHKKLGSQTDLEFRIRTAIQTLADVLPLDVQCDHKDSQISANLRKEADKLFFAEKGNIVGLLQAWELYSRSISFAESTSRELPLAYANRSAILFNIHKYGECIRDINRALELNYPDVLRVNLLRRKAKCLKLLGRPEAEEVCEEARRWLQNIKLNDDNREQLKQKIQIATKTVELPKAEDNNLKTSLPNIKWHEKIPCASNNIDIRYNEIYGRHIVSTRAIDVGEILVHEKPYALLLKQEYIYTHCSHCFIRAWDSIPCEYCIHAMYCSEKCKSEAWQQYHDIECSIKGYFLSLTMNDLTSLSLKLTVLAVREAGNIDKLRQELGKDDCEDFIKKGFSKEGVYYSDKYKPLYYLETHEAKRWLPEVVSMTINIALILYFLNTLASFFGESLNKTLQALSENEDAIFVGKLLAHHYMMIPLNDHEINETAYNGHNHSLGAVVFPFSSLFNHSCNPNAARITVVGDNNVMHQIIVAQHPIKKGTQIFYDYGFDFTMESFSKRKDLCRKYHFTCNCKPCKDNWPEFEKLPSMLSLPSSREKKTEIRKAINKITIFEKDIVEADIKSLDANSETLLANLAQSVNILFKHTSQPTKEFFKSVLLFRQAFLLIHGNRFKL